MIDQEPYFVYRKNEQGICIIRCYAKESRVVIPDEIDGHPVTGLDAYAFAAERDEEPENPGDFPCICGELLEELALPKTILRIGRYVFYNCWNFRHFSFYSNISYMGAGAFTGCKKLSRLTLRDGGSERSCLREVLVDLNHTVTVWQEEQQCAALYPAFFEEAVENTPARIIETHTHGVGIQYRNAFKNTRMDWGEYDRLFAVGKYNMEEDEAVHMAACRLISPVRPEEEAKEEYTLFLREHIEEATDLFLKEEDKGLLFWLADQFVQDREELDGMMKRAEGNMEAVSLLMDISHRRFPKREKKGFSL